MVTTGAFYQILGSDFAVDPAGPARTEDWFSSLRSIVETNEPGLLGSLHQTRHRETSPTGFSVSENAFFADGEELSDTARSEAPNDLHKAAKKDRWWRRLLRSKA